ncbi:amidase signature domain-containing protein [Aspergillus bertholletiae]|uniref:Amidase signature domain-containing protein n=1 Tax=Aspergillus bertholletiae TaxID=1226010 RepID=A0A5N7AR95_9EURO|nr:amidase signature domain-containing protein [Aspergillus bertholletiae]
MLLYRAFGGELLCLLLACVTVHAWACANPPLIRATRDDLVSGLSENCYLSVDLVHAYVARINEVNSTLRPILEINPDALHDAEMLDRERHSGSSRGELHGLPVLVKDNIGTADKMQTTAGSYSLYGSRVREDATAVRRLRDYGAIILGKTSMSEWMNFRSSNTSNGWSPRGGQTLGAYHPMQDPEGSSSGSAVAVDLGLAMAALGTETMGSILFPSEANNIVGIKPTVGLTSRYGVIPISEHQDTIGPMARTVKDAAWVLGAIAGRDERDNYTSASPDLHIAAYANACQLDGLQGKRIGIPRNALASLAMEAHGHAVLSAFEAALSVFTEAGAIILQDANFTSWEEFLVSKSITQVLRADFSSNIEGYLSTLATNPNNIHSLQDLRIDTQGDPHEDYPRRDTAEWDAALAAGLNNTSPEFWPMYQNNLRLGGEGGVLGALVRHRLDALILPTSLAAYVPSVIGTPVITVPLGAYPKGTKTVYNKFGNLVQVAENIPFGISFMGTHWSEKTLIGMAYAFEQRTLFRQKLKHYIEPHTEIAGRQGGGDDGACT